MPAPRSHSAGTDPIGQRDRGMGRVRSMTRWTTVSAAAVSTVLGLVYTNLQPKAAPAAETSPAPVPGPPSTLPPTSYPPLAHKEDNGANDRRKGSAGTTTKSPTSPTGSTSSGSTRSVSTPTQQPLSTPTQAPSPTTQPSHTKSGAS